MTDDLNIPQVPEARPEDPEDVSWALSTAEAMWARGDHAEGIKWVRRAAEAASEAEDDSRALELAKAAADLQALLARRSMSERPSDRALPSAKPTPSVAARIAAPSGPISVAPPTNRSVPPIAPGGGKSAPPSSRSVPSVAPKAPSGGAASSGGKSGRSIPPIPLPSKASSPPPANAAPASGARASKAPPRPLATSSTAQGPAAGKGILSNKTDEKEKKKGRGRRSRENLEAEARAAGVLEPSPQPAVAMDTDEVAVLESLESEDAIPLQSNLTKGTPKPYESDATVITNRAELENQKKKAARGAPDWDASPTQNTVGEIDDESSERKTRVGAPPASRSPSGVTATAQRSSQAPASIPPRANRASPSIIPHDDSIQTCQAVRVVVWRDAQGVHVAPAGTVVSAIKIDAVLVALEPTADLTAWLSRKDR